MMNTARHVGLRMLREAGVWSLGCSRGETGQEAPGWSPCLGLSADRRFLPQGVQTTPGQMQRMSRRRTVRFGQCQVVMGLGLGWGQASERWWPFSY